MKTTISRQVLIFFLIAVHSFQLQAQSAKELIREIKPLMLERYIFLDQAEAVINHLEQLEEKEHFKPYTTAAALAEAGAPLAFHSE